MSAPNIVAVTNIIGNTGVLAVTNSATAIVTNSGASGKVYKINCLIVSNVDASNSATLTVDLYRSSTAYTIINAVTVAINTSFTPIDKTLSLYLLEGDTLRLTANANSRLQAVCSWEEIAKSAGSYTLILSNASGAAAIYVPGITYSSIPTYTTAAGSIGSNYETTAINTQVVATSDSAITYSLATGALPSGSTLYANGVITGTAPVDSSSTTYSFSITATDAELQDVTRSFTLTINTDVVTWSSPGSGTTYTVVGNTPISNVTLSATSAAGYGVTYTANALPTGVTLSSGVISGTPTVESNITSLLTATSSTTNRSATNTIYWVVTLNDQYFKYNSLLISSTVVTNTFATDLSSNNLDITIVGDTKPSKFDPFELGYYSGYFDGTGDGLVINGNAGPIGTEDFTWECYAYISTMGGDYPRIFESNTGASGSFQVYLSGGTLVVGGNGTGTITSYSIASLTNQWLHLCITRTGSAMRIFVNGVLRAYSASGGNNFPSGGSAWRTLNEGGGIIGYLSNMRVVRGSIVSAYSTSSTTTGTTIFTPPTSPLTAIAGTQFLGMQSSGFVDTSANAFAITVNGNTAVNPFQPFTPNSSYATYGSTYFDGTGDYLTVASSSAFNISGNFTVEGWYYFNALPGAGANDNLWTFSGVTTYNPYLYLWGDGTIVLRTAQTSGTVFTVTHNFGLNIWYHIAVVKSSTNFTLYVNGTSVGTGTSSAIVSENKSLEIGGQSTFGLTGYLSNFRVVNGTAVYTSNFTPSTTPLTAIANTSLLTCQSTTFIDNSANAFAITVNGNTQPVIQNPFVNTFTSPVAYSPTTTGSSMYFDGTTDWLITPASTTNQLTLNFTIEFWFYAVGLTGGLVNINSATGPNSGSGLSIYLDTGGVLKYFVNGNGTIVTGPTVTAGSWYHVALVRSSSTNTLYLNGISSATNAATPAYGLASIGVGRLYNDNTGSVFTGYISNVRIVKGTALYTGPFVPSNSPLPAVQNTIFLVSSTITPPVYDAAEISDIENVGTSKLTASNSPYYSSYSGFFDGTGDYLTLAANAAFGFGTGDFTVEMWIYPTSTKNTQFLFDTRDNGAATGTRYALALNNTTSMQPIISVGTGTIVTSSQTVAINSWYHIAFSIASGTVRLFINGTQVGSVSSAIDVGASSGPAIGTVGDARGSYDGYFAGYISNLRVVKGTALYTAAFTPPTAPLTAIANTSLLTCQSNRFIDNSTNAFTITRNGDAKVSALQPFGGSNLTKYSSVYFDGTGDSLKILNNPNINLGSGDFTLECWVYFNAVNIQVTIINKGWNSSSAYASYLIWMQNDATLRFLASSNGSSWDIANEKVMGTMTSGSWIHIAVTRSGTTFRAFVNGVINNSFTFTSSASLANIAAQTLFIGDRTNGDTSLNGYISDVRITNGYARYTTTFTPPTVPLLGF